MKLSRLLLVTVLLGTALGLSQQSASATGSTPPIIEISVGARLSDIDSSNNGLTAFAVSQEFSNGNPRYTGPIRRTTDAGLTWNTIAGAPTGYWTAISTSTNGETVAVVGETAAGAHRLFVSIDSGDTWTQKGPTNSAFHDVAVSGDGSKIVVARSIDGVSYSTDGGDSWTLATRSGNPLFANDDALNADVAVNADGSVIVASRRYGSVWRSANGGATWDDLDSATTRVWQDISISDDGATVFGVVFNDTGYIWTTTSATLFATPSLGFASGHSVRGAISPDGRSFIAASYGAEPRILRGWNPTTTAPGNTTWASVSAGTSVLGLTITNGGERFITVTEGSGGRVYTYNPPFPLPVVTSAVDYNCYQPAAGPPSGGTRVIIDGQHLYNASVTIGGQPAPIIYTYRPFQEFSVAVPAGVAGPADIVVNTAGGSITLAGGFTYVTPPENWSRLGSSITTTNVEEAGTSMAISSDGTTLAIGSPWYDVAGVNRGRVRIMRWNGSAWVQLGSDLVGGADNDSFGMSVALDTDGDTVVIGAPYNNGGYANVYRYGAGSWGQLGVSVSAEYSGDEFGRAVAISADGNTIAVGASYNNGGGSSRGQVRVYDYAGASWSPRGTINGGVDGGRFGVSVALSADATTVVAGAPSASGGGYASAYRYGNGSWSQLGSTLSAQASGDDFGSAVAISGSGDVIAVGAPENDDAGSDRGQIRIYELNGNSWTSRGIINGDTNSGEAGATLAMTTDGNMVAYSSITTCRGGTVGSVSVREFRGGQWQQRGGSIDSPFTDVGFGRVVALSGSGDVVAASSSEHSNYRGAVAAWRYTLPVVSTPPVFVVPPSTSSPSTSTPGTTVPAPTPVEPPSASSRDALPVGDPAALFGRSAAANGALPLRVGEQLNVTLDDFTPNEDVWIGLFSNPVTIATVKADSRGVLSTAFTIPPGITGDHTLVIYGTESGNGVRIPVQLTAPTLPVTGPNTSGSPGILSVLATLILTLGLTLVIWVYKRTPGVLS